MCDQCEKLESIIFSLEMRIEELEGELDSEPEPYIPWSDLD